MKGPWLKLSSGGGGCGLVIGHVATVAVDALTAGERVE